MITRVHSSSIDWTAVGAIGTWAAALAVPASAVFVWLQLRQAKQAAQSQVYQTLLDRAERVGLNEALDTVRDLGCTTYQEFLRLSPAKQNQVRLVAEFFNEIQHMLPPDARMLKLRYVERLWSQSILNCTNKLWDESKDTWDKDKPHSWWLAGIRADDEHRYFYRGFERLCWAIKYRDPNYRKVHGRQRNLYWKKRCHRRYW